MEVGAGHQPTLVPPGLPPAQAGVVSQGAAMGLRVESADGMGVGDAAVELKTLQLQGCLELAVWVLTLAAAFAGQGPEGLAAPLAEGLGTFKHGAQR